MSLPTAVIINDDIETKEEEEEEDQEAVYKAEITCWPCFFIVFTFVKDLLLSIVPELARKSIWEIEQYLKLFLEISYLSFVFLYIFRNFTTPRAFFIHSRAIFYIFFIYLFGPSLYYILFIKGDFARRMIFTHLEFN